MNASQRQNYVWLAVEFGVAVTVVYNIVDGSPWLAWILGTSLAVSFHLYGLVTENKHLFNIADAELVRVSAIVEVLQDKIADLETRVDAQRERTLNP